MASTLTTILSVSLSDTRFHGPMIEKKGEFKEMRNKWMMDDISVQHSPLFCSILAIDGRENDSKRGKNNNTCVTG